MLRLADRWLWDFWLADDGAARHVFYLQAPRSLGDPQLRHVNASIGHAVSHDLRSWRVLPDALQPGAPGEWDDRATWTGSVLRHDGTWWMFYTGTSTADGGAVQRVGAATSADLVTWRRHPANPLIEASPPWYEAVPTSMWRDVAWRDPFAVPSGDSFRCYLTARASDGPADGRGVIAVAMSADLVNWRVAAPAYAPGEFTELEVPQVVDVGAHSYLLFSVSVDAHGRRWRERTGVAPRTATYYVTAVDTHGPFTGPPRSIDVGQAADELYAGKLVAEPTGSLSFLAARFHRPGDGFAGELADPMPLTQRTDGTLTSLRTSEGDGGGDQTGAVERWVR